MSFAVLSFFALVFTLTLLTFIESWPAVAQEFVVGLSVFVAFRVLEGAFALIFEAMKRERSSSASEGNLHRLTCLRRVTPTPSPDNLAPTTDRSMAEMRAAEVREQCRSLTLADLIAEIERRCAEGPGTPATRGSTPVEATRGGNSQGETSRRRSGRGSRGEGSRRRMRSPLPPRPPSPTPPESPLLSARAHPPPLTAICRPPGPRYIAAGELGEIKLPHRFLIDPELSGHVVSRATAELLGLRVQPLQGPLPPGIEGRVIRSEGGTSVIVGSTAARVKIGPHMEVCNFTVAGDKVETRLGREIMQPFDLTRDRVNGNLYQSQTTKVGVSDPRALIRRRA